MAAPRKRGNNNHNQDNKSGGAWKYSFLLVGLSAVGYYVYKNYYSNQHRNYDNESDNDPQSITPKGGYKKLKLDIDEEANLSTTFFVPTTKTPKGNNDVGDGDNNKQNIDVRHQYLSSMLKQRRFSSVLFNNHLHHGNVEHYFHLGLDSSSPFLSQFTRIKWLIIVRSKSDVKLVAKRILNEFPQFVQEKNGNKLPEPIGSTDRFYMLQISSIVIVSCGIGASSISILLQEITKLLVDAGAFAPNEDNASLRYDTSYVEYILLISAPGINVSPSNFIKKRKNSLDMVFNKKDNRSNRMNRMRRHSLRDNLLSININNDDDDKRPSQITGGEIPVIIPTSCYNEQLINYRSFVSCGEIIQNRSMKFDRNLISDIKIRCSFLRSLKPKTGKGLSVQYFNEALSHNSVAIQQDNSTKSKFIQSCIDQGVKYVDMESGFFAAFCHKLNISSVAIVGIEFDIATPKNIKVSHESAIHATLDVFCQYLWDRISMDKNNNKKYVNPQPLKRAISNKYNVDKNDDNDEEIENITVIPIDRSNSFPSTTRPIRVNKQNNNNSDLAAPPAEYSQFKKLSSNEKQLQSEGS